MLASLSYDLEYAYAAQGRQVFGVDEVGRGCLAGPVVAACVGFDWGAGGAMSQMERLRSVIVNDSKKLNRKQRQESEKVIREVASYVQVGVVGAAMIDEVNILQATFQAMREVCADWLFDQAALFLVDGNQQIPEFAGAQEVAVGGDGKVFSIAAASIVAKEFRDTLMERLHDVYPEYNFAQHKGYGTKEHYRAICKFGLCKEHRRTFCISKAKL